MGEWTLFSNHGHVLVCLARDNEARLRDVANDVGITERAVQKIVRELQQAGFIAITKHGRCNRYDIQTRQHLRHPLESDCSVGRLLQLLNVQEKTTKPSAEKLKSGKTRPRKTSAEAIAPSQPPDAPKPVENAVQAVAKTEPASKAPTSEAPPPPPVETSKKVTRKAEPDKKNDEEESPDDRQQGSLF